MKRLIFTSLFLMLALSLSAAAKITFEATELNFGEAESGKVVDLQFKFENTGDEKLIIKNISSTCGCTVTKVDKTEYQPGEKGVIPVQFLTRGYTGKVVKTITVSTNDQENVYTRLSITGNVVMKDFAAVEIVTSDQVDFKEVTLGEKYHETFKIKNSGTIELRLVEVTLVPEITMDFSKKILAPNEEAEIKVTFKPMEAGKFASFPRIRTNALKERNIIFKIKADVKSQS